MSSILTDPMARDMLMYARPRDCHDLLLYSNQVLYSALSEWIRAICQDDDPLAPSDVPGVTRPYLEGRAASILHHMDEGCLSLHTKYPVQPPDLVHWMVDAMLLIGDLQMPREGVVACTAGRGEEVAPGIRRVYGPRRPYTPGGPAFTAQLGLAHFEMSASLTPEELAGLRLPSRDAVLQPFFTAHRAQQSLDQGRFIGFQLMVDMDTFRQPAVAKALLTYGWPFVAHPLAWQDANAWFLPDFSLLLQYS